jgi:hypothetical protein
MKVTFTVEDDSLDAPITAAGFVEGMGPTAITNAYRKLDPAAYDEIDTGEVDEENKAIKVKLTDEQIIRKIAGIHLQSILDNVRRQAEEEARAQAANIPPITFTVDAPDNGNRPQTKRAGASGSSGAAGRGSKARRA